MARVPCGGRSARSTAGAAGGRRRPRLAGAVAFAGLAAGGLLACGPGSAAHGSPAPSSSAGAAGVAFDESWHVGIPGGQIVLSSPVPVSINGTPSVVVGSTDGRVYAVSLGYGISRPGWPVTVPGSDPVDSTPSINGSIVYVGTGDVGDSHVGGYLAINTSGSLRWYRTIVSQPAGGSVSAVQAGLAFGRLDGQRAVVAGSLGQYVDAMSSNTGSGAAGFPWFAADSTFSTAAIADLYGDGRDFVVEGGDSTAGNAYGVQYANGGHIRVLSAAGNTGTGQPGGGLVCQYNTTQGVESSPAVGPFLDKGAVGIVTGTGVAWAGAPDTDKVIAVSSHCGLLWRASLDGTTQGSPALVDALGDGHLQVAEGTSTGQNSGTVYLLNGGSGRPFWTHDVGGQVIGSIVSADLNGHYQDLLVPTTSGLYVLDGRTGRQVALLGNGLVALQSAPLVTDDASGHIGITVAGYNGGGGEIVHWDVAGTSGRLAAGTGAWPMFHHDPQLTGTTMAQLAR